MTKNTGYQVIDLQDIELNSIPENTKIKGIFNKLKNNNRKPLYITGINRQNYLCGDTYASSYYMFTSDKYLIYFQAMDTTIILWVESDDTIYLD